MGKGVVGEEVGGGGEERKENGGGGKNGEMGKMLGKKTSSMGEEFGEGQVGWVVG